MRVRRNLLQLLVFAGVLFLPQPRGLVAESGGPTFERDLQPVLQKRCKACHGPALAQAGLRVTSLEALQTGGKSGPAFVPGKPLDSLLLTMVANGSMPKGGPALPPEEVDLIRRWIEASATPAETAGGATAHPKVGGPEAIITILGAKCFVCHGRRTQKGGLDLRTREAILRGGSKGPAIVPGKPEESLLIQKIEQQEMPPKHLQEQFSVRSVTSAELETLRAWISSGAPGEHVYSSEPEYRLKESDAAFWAFQPPRKSAIPSTSAGQLPDSAIDRFLLDALRKKGLGFSQPASRLALLRRATVGLTGLAPTPEEISAFLADSREDAWERLVDRLLSSPAYGEQWGRYWLEAAGYADSEGAVSADSIRTHAWRYRDYVIRSLNADKPYDRFLMEQIAGDEMFDYKAASEYTKEQQDHLIATGFLRMAPDATYSTEQNFMPERFDVIANQIEILSSSVMGLTLGCARCHDHKFDPLPQRDYYRLAAILQPAYDPYDWRIPNLNMIGVGAKPDPALTRQLPLRDTAEQEAVRSHNAPLEARIAELKEQIKDRFAPFRRQIQLDNLARLPETVRDEILAAAAKDEASRDAVQQYLVKNFESELNVSDREIEKRFPESRDSVSELRKQIGQLSRELRPEPTIRALYDMGEVPTPVYQLLRGDPAKLGPEIQPGVPEILSKGLAPYRVVPPDHTTRTTGRRTALAKWLIQPDHPLTARVIVNRVWQHHFGTGLVETPGNFGTTGARPGNAALLDWLAVEFVEQGWSLKKLHKMILLTEAYRQSSRGEAAALEADPDNRLLSRFPLQRLEGDALRDIVLQVSGQLDRTAGGPPAPIKELPSGEVTEDPETAMKRRSIYLLKRRSTPVTALDVFDAPQLNPNCLKRPVSTVPLQSLQLLNGSLTRKAAEHVAGQLLDSHETGSNRVQHAFLRIFNRPPEASEVEDALTALTQLRTHWREGLKSDSSPEPKGAKSEWMAMTSFVHSLFNSAEFLYVE